MLTLGVIADTHIPDRARYLHPKAISTFQQADVRAILHAGDISTPKILSQLEETALVYAVRGNRDLFGFKNLPHHRILEFEDITIGLTHGHGNWPAYIADRLLLMFRPTKFNYYEGRARSIFPKANVIVLGHNHAPANHWEKGQLIFNPGSACCPNLNFPDLSPSVGLLHINGDNVEGEIVLLK